jgi:UDP-N-acetylmuramoyl-tripeptide--D-alanyl-D-alanine ligase
VAISRRPGLALAEMPGLAGRGARHEVHVRDGDALHHRRELQRQPRFRWRATIRQLGEIRPQRRGRRLAILGAMRELGSGSDDYHLGLAGAVTAAGVDRAILVGEEIKPLAATLRQKLSTLYVPDAAAALAAVNGELAADDVLLVKGSNSVGLGRLVAELQGDVAS